MSDDIKLKPGEGLTVNLKRPKRKGRRDAARDKQTEPARRGIVPLDDEGARYIRRPGKSILTFYDLGTRLRSVSAGASFDGSRKRAADDNDTPEPGDGRFNEYVEMEWERALTAEDYRPTSADFQALDRVLLGSLAPDNPADPLDPLGFSPANVTGRSLAHCMPLPHENYQAVTQLAPFATVGSTTYQLTHDAPSGGEPPWAAREEEEADASERWNPLNLASGVAQRHGILTTRKPARPPLSAAYHKDALHLYEYFDTSDAAEHKITSLPNYEADEVEFKLAKKAAIRVYLKPRFYKYALLVVPDSGPVVIHQAWLGRTPVYPSPVIESSAAWACFLARSPLAHALAADPPDGLRLEHLGFFPGDVWRPAGVLLGVVVQEQKFFYVWSRTERQVGEFDPPLLGGGFGLVSEFTACS